MSDNSATTGLAVLTRPNGKAYRARKAPSVVGPVDCEDDGRTYVMVLRTHDTDLAYPLAEARIPTSPEHPHLSWERIGMAWGEQKWIRDDERGIPCVIFEVDYERY